MKIWNCKIGEVDESKLPPGSDLPMRAAVREAYQYITGQEPGFIFSGWGAKLNEYERAVVENREPKPPADTLLQRVQLAIECIEDLDDHSPISAADLKEIRSILLVKEQSNG